MIIAKIYNILICILFFSDFILKHFGHDIDVSRKVNKDKMRLRKLTIREMNKSVADMMRSFRAGTYNLKKVRDDDDGEADSEEDDDDNE